MKFSYQKPVRSLNLEKTTIAVPLPLHKRLRRVSRRTEVPIYQLIQQMSDRCLGDRKRA